MISVAEYAADRIHPRLAVVSGDVDGGSARGLDEGRVERGDDGDAEPHGFKHGQAETFVEARVEEGRGARK